MTSIAVVDRYPQRLLNPNHDSLVVLLEGKRG